MDQAAIWYGGRTRPRRLCVRWVPAPLPKQGAEPPSPIFGPCPLRPKGWMDQAGAWHRGGPLSMLRCARLGSSSHPKRGRSLPFQFSAHFYRGQTAGCIKMPRGMEVGLSRGEFVLDGDPAPCTKGGGAPSTILRVEVRVSELDRKCGALPVVANFVALEQQVSKLELLSPQLWTAMYTVNHKNVTFYL